MKYGFSFRLALIGVMIHSLCTLDCSAQDSELSLDSLFSVSKESTGTEKDAQVRYLQGGAPFLLIDSTSFTADEVISAKVEDPEIDRMVEQLDRSKLSTWVGWSGKQTLKRDILSLQVIKQRINTIPEKSTRIEVTNDFEQLEIKLEFISNDSNQNGYALKLHSEFSDQILLGAGLYQPILTVWSRESPSTILVLEFEEMELLDQQLYRLRLDESWERDSIKKLREQASRNQAVSISTN